MNIVIILNNVIPGCINCEYSHNSCEQLVWQNDKKSPNWLISIPLSEIRIFQVSVGTDGAGVRVVDYIPHGVVKGKHHRSKESCELSRIPGK